MEANVCVWLAEGGGFMKASLTHIPDIGVYKQVRICTSDIFAQFCFIIS
jgi:hypothetical protein